MTAISQDFDTVALAAWLRAALPGLAGPMAVERIAGGQSNPTFFVTFGADRFVLRKQPHGELLPSAHAIDREYRVMRALGPTAAPVPRMILYCDDRSIVGTPFYLMERVEGRVHHDCALPEMKPEDRRPFYRSLAESLAALHALDPGRIGLGDYGRHGGYFTRQIARWSKQWELSRLRDDALVERLIGWLPENIPDDDASAIAHGDYRIGNVMADGREPRVAAILDWELSTLGHPMADLAHCCIAWHSAPDEYGGVRGLDLAEHGLPEQAEFEAWYYRSSGHGHRLEPFHMAFALFRFAVVFEGIAARARAGNAAGANAPDVTRLSAVFAERACAVLDG